MGLQPAVQPDGVPANPSSGKWEAEAERLRCERDEWRRRAEVAEERARGAAALAAERGDHIEELGWMLRMMEPTAVGTTSELVSTVSAPQVRPQVRPGERRWRRGRNSLEPGP
ncbi:MAG: hypothetical protein ACRDYA_13305 [Egibacteraceae bacterium]